MNRRLMIAGLLALALLPLLIGCVAENEVHRAQRALDQARAVHAEYLAPYEFASAENFLAQAKVELNESDYDSAQKFATRANQMAQQAQAIAEKKHASPMVPFQPPPQPTTVPAPAPAQPPAATPPPAPPPAQPTPPPPPPGQ